MQRNIRKSVKLSEYSNIHLLIFISDFLIISILQVGLIILSFIILKNNAESYLYISLSKDNILSTKTTSLLFFILKQFPTLISILSIIINVFNISPRLLISLNAIMQNI